MLSKKYLVLAAIVGGMFAAANAGAVTTIAGGPHDLTGSGPVDAAAGSPTDPCRFCHTPHNADNLVPLWGRTGADGTFTPYASSTLTTPAGVQPAGISLGCLSCHDGVTAFDAIDGDAGNTTANTMSSAAGVTTGLIGENLANDHPVSMSYSAAEGADSAINTLGGGTWVKLFNNGVETDAVECATCHEPHNQDFWGPGVANTGKFLRVDPAGMCAECHGK